MTQRDLNSAVARRTGENLCEIRRRGFSFVPVKPVTRHRRRDALAAESDAVLNQGGRGTTSGRRAA